MFQHEEAECLEHAGGVQVELVRVEVEDQDYGDVAISGVHKVDEVFLAIHDVVLQIGHLYVVAARPKNHSNM